ncbi:Transcription factor [Umbelopsis nana]
MIATNTTTTVPFFDQRPHDKIALNNPNAAAVAATSVLKQVIPEVAVVEPSMLQCPADVIQQQPVPIAPPVEGLPDNYANLPQNSKLDEEPNPFEMSFSDISSTATTTTATKIPAPAAATTTKPVLPPVASMESPSTGIPTFKKATVDQYAWGSLRAGPLSPSMLQGPVNNTLVSFPANTAAPMKPSVSDEFVPYQPQIPTSMQYSFQANTMNGQKYGVYQQPQQPVKPAPGQQITTFPVSQPQPVVKLERPYQTATEFIHHENGASSRKGTRINSQPTTETKPPMRTKRQEHGELMEGLGPVVKRNKSVTSEQDEDEKRRNFLERNRQAALKCRQRKKAWLNDLQVKVESLSQENEQLTVQANAFRDEIIHLRTLLHSHKDCQVANDNSSRIRVALEKPVPPAVVSSASQSVEE